MKSEMSKTSFEGLDLWTVRLGRFVARGTAPRGQRPESWSMQGFLGLSGRVMSEELRGRGTHGRALSKALRAVEAGRV